MICFLPYVCVFYVALSDMMQHGPHLLAPTGSNYTKHNSQGTVLAGFHYDLNFLTIHGKSRFPGLFIWTREMHKMPVRVPDGCLLLQAGKQVCVYSPLHHHRGQTPFVSLSWESDYPLYPFRGLFALVCACVCACCVMCLLMELDFYIVTLHRQ